MAELQTQYWSRPVGPPAESRLNPRASSHTAFSTRASSATTFTPREEPPDIQRVAAGRLRALFIAISDLAFVLRKGGLIAEFHAPPDHEFLFTPEDVAGKRISDLLPAALAQQAMYHLEKTFHTRRPQTFSVTYEMGGRTREFQARLALSNTDEVIAVVRDITDKRRLERDILEISNREQMRIGQDLHDGLGQHLTGITFLTRALENNLSSKQLPEAAEAAEIGKLILQALTQTRSLARGLFPVELESHGLVPAIKELAETLENTFGLNCRFIGDETIAIPDQTISSHLFRLTQEAVNNSIKHGKARHITIDLQKSADRVVLSIRDDGAGFPAEALKTKGLGLRIMSYRAQKIGGTFDIQPGETGGAVVTVSFANRPGHLKQFDRSKSKHGTEADSLA